MHYPTSLVFPLVLAFRLTTAIPIEALSLKDLDIGIRDSSDLENRDSGFAAMSCVDSKSYSVTSQNGPFPDAPSLAGAEQCVANAAGCSISDAKSYSVSVSIISGINVGLNIGDIAQVGFTSQVIISVGTAESITTTVNCPPNCTCGIQVIPTMYHVEGWQKTVQKPLGGGNPRSCPQTPKMEPYSVNFPVIDPKAAKNNQAVVQYSACVPPGMLCPSDPNMPICPPS